eukprot:2753223-Amphidinium_carterae.1
MDQGHRAAVAAVSSSRVSVACACRGVVPCMCGRTAELAFVAAPVDVFASPAEAEELLADEELELFGDEWPEEQQEPQGESWPGQKRARALAEEEADLESELDALQVDFQ